MGSPPILNEEKENDREDERGVSGCVPSARAAAVRTPGRRYGSSLLLRGAIWLSGWKGRLRREEDGRWKGRVPSVRRRAHGSAAETAARTGQAWERRG